MRLAAVAGKYCPRTTLRPTLKNVGVILNNIANEIFLHVVRAKIITHFVFNISVNNEDIWLCNEYGYTIRNKTQNIYSAKFEYFQ